MRKKDLLKILDGYDRDAHIMLFNWDGKHGRNNLLHLEPTLQNNSRSMVFTLGVSIMSSEAEFDALEERADLNDAEKEFETARTKLQSAKENVRLHNECLED